MLVGKGDVWVVPSSGLLPTDRDKRGVTGLASCRGVNDSRLLWRLRGVCLIGGEVGGVINSSSLSSSIFGGNTSDVVEASDLCEEVPSVSELGTRSEFILRRFTSLFFLFRPPRAREYLPEPRDMPDAVELNVERVGRGG